MLVFVDGCVEAFFVVGFGYGESHWDGLDDGFCPECVEEEEEEWQ